MKETTRGTINLALSEYEQLSLIAVKHGFSLSRVLGRALGQLLSQPAEAFNQNLFLIKCMGGK